MSVGLALALWRPQDVAIQFVLVETLSPLAFFAGFSLAGRSLRGEHAPAFSSSAFDAALAFAAAIAATVSAVILVGLAVEGPQDSSFLAFESLAVLWLSAVGVRSNGYVVYRLVEEWRTEDTLAPATVLR